MRGIAECAFPFIGTGTHNPMRDVLVDVLADVLEGVVAHVEDVVEEVWCRIWCVMCSGVSCCQHHKNHLPVGGKDHSHSIQEGGLGVRGDSGKKPHVCPGAPHPKRGVVIQHVHPWCIHTAITEIVEVVGHCCGGGGGRKAVVTTVPSSEEERRGEEEATHKIWCSSMADAPQQYQCKLLPQRYQCKLLHLVTFI